MASRHEDSHAFYSFVLLVTIVLTLSIAFGLRGLGCVPSYYFPFSVRGCTAVGLVVMAGILSLLSKGMTVPLWWTGQDHFWKPRVSLDFIPPRFRPQWFLGTIILMLSLTALCLLLLTSGGSTSPFSVYLGLFPIVISVLASSKRFVVLTVVLTLGVYVCAYFFAEPLKPITGHEVPYGIASVFTFSVALAFTAGLIFKEIQDDKDATSGEHKTGSSGQHDNPRDRD